MDIIEVVVRSTVGTGKSHVLHTIEKALIAEYGDGIEVVCDELRSERNSIGADITRWNRPQNGKVQIVMHELCLPTHVPKPNSWVGHQHYQHFLLWGGHAGDVKGKLPVALQVAVDEADKADATPPKEVSINCNFMMLDNQFIKRSEK